jgi:alkanesulfonate monooxygenase SsuD/methylene tetrahydromethanopterin reductase-like flavin-dependent oxidoreductase (luciferase family)
VLVVPYRNPLLQAKMLATIDVLSKGASSWAPVSAGSARSSRRSARRRSRNAGA